MATLDVTWDMLSVWHARLAQADRNEVTKIAQSGAVYGLEMAEM